MAPPEKQLPRPPFPALRIRLRRIGPGKYEAETAKRLPSLASPRPVAPPDRFAIGSWYQALRANGPPYTFRARNPLASHAEATVSGERASSDAEHPLRTRARWPGDPPQFIELIIPDDPDITGIRIISAEDAPEPGRPFSMPTTEVEVDLQRLKRND